MEVLKVSEQARMAAPRVQIVGEVKVVLAEKLVKFAGKRGLPRLPELWGLTGLLPLPALVEQLEQADLKVQAGSRQL